MRNSSDMYYINTALGAVKILPTQAEPAILIYDRAIGLIFSGTAELEIKDKYQIELKKPVTIILSPDNITYYDKIIQPFMFEKNNTEQLKNDLKNTKTFEVIFPNNSKSHKLD